MNDREMVKYMLEQGKISGKQAQLLFDALNESERKVERLFKEVVVQKQKRQESAKRFMMIFGLIAILGIFTLINLTFAQKTKEPKAVRLSSGGTL